MPTIQNGVLRHHAFRIWVQPSLQILALDGDDTAVVPGFNSSTALAMLSWRFATSICCWRRLNRDSVFRLSVFGRRQHETNMEYIAPQAKAALNGWAFSTLRLYRITISLNN